MGPKTTIKKSPPKALRPAFEPDELGLLEENRLTLDAVDMHLLAEEVNLASDQNDFGDMNEHDARLSGYISPDGRKSH